MQKLLNHPLYKKYQYEARHRMKVFDVVQDLLPGYLSDHVTAAHLADEVLYLTIADNAMYFSLIQCSSSLLTAIKRHGVLANKVRVLVRPATNSVKHVDVKKKSPTPIPDVAIRHFSLLLRSLKKHKKLLSAVKRLVEQ